MKPYVVWEEGTTGREVSDSGRIQDFFPDPNIVLLQEKRDQLLKLDIGTGEKTLLLEAEEGFIKSSSLSPDAAWLSFVLGRPDGRAAVLLAPVPEAQAAPPPESDWILLFDEDHYLDSPAWSPDGNRLYYVSERDGYCCLWTQRLDPKTKNPVGDTVGIYHVHQGRMTMNVPPGNARVVVAEDKLVLWMAQGTGNIYMATPKWK